MHPALSVDRLGRTLGVVPVALHHDVAAGQELARLTPRDRSPGVGIDDLDLDVRVHLAYGGAAILERLLAQRLRGDRGGLGHAEGDAHLGDPHLGADPLHHLDRTRRAGHDPGPQRAVVEL